MTIGALNLYALMTLVSYFGKREGSKDYILIVSIIDDPFPVSSLSPQQLHSNEMGEPRVLVCSDSWLFSIPEILH